MTKTQAQFDRLLREAFLPRHNPPHQCRVCRVQIKHGLVCDDCQDALR
jgi:hypothetical protein